MSTPSMHPDLELSNIMVVGSINIDEFFEVPHIVNTGETIASTRYTRRIGGKGANQAVAAARAGASVSFHFHVHCDDTARLRKALSLDGIDVTDLIGQREVSCPNGRARKKLLMKSSPREHILQFQTGRALIQLSTTTKDNSIILFPGANHASADFSLYCTTAPGANERTEEWERRLFYGPPPPTRPSTKYCLLQNEVPLSRTIGAAQWAEERRSNKVMFKEGALDSFPRKEEVKRTMEG